MIPVLFPKDEYQLNHLGKGLLSQAYSCVVTEGLNDKFELEMEYPLKGDISSDIEVMDIIYCLPYYNARPHAFRIYDIEINTQDDLMFIRAVSITYDLTNVLIPSIELFSTDTPEQVGDKLTQALPTERMRKIYRILINMSAKEPLTQSKWEYSTPTAILNKLRSSVFPGDILRIGSDIVITEKRGMDKGIVIRYGKNLDGYKVTKNTKSLVTQIIGFIPNQQKPSTPSSNTIPELPQIPKPGEMTPMKQDLIYSKVVNSQYIDNYPTPFTQLIDFSQISKDLRTKEELDALAETYFTGIKPGCDMPSINISVNLFQLSDLPEYYIFKDLEQIELGDTVTVYDPGIIEPTTLRVIEIVYDVLKNKTRSIRAGDPQESLIQQQNSVMDVGLKTVLQYTDNVKNSVIPMMNGKNKIYRGFDEPAPVDSTNGDLWYKLLDITGNTSKLHIFTGGAWTPVEYTANDISSGILNLNKVTLEGLHAGLITSGKLMISNNLTLAHQDSSRPPILSVDNDGNVVFNVDKMVIKDQEADSRQAILDLAQKHMETLVGQMSKVDNTQEIGMVSKYTNQALEQILFRLPTNSQESTIRITNGGLEAYRVMTEDSVHIGNIRIEKYGDEGIAFRYVKRR